VKYLLQKVCQVSCDATQRSSAVHLLPFIYHEDVLIYKIPNIYSSSLLVQRPTPFTKIPPIHPLLTEYMNKTQIRIMKRKDCNRVHKEMPLLVAILLLFTVSEALRSMPSMLKLLLVILKFYSSS
jgi:hypothetical protein